jgi:hypothetical protein
VGRPRKDEFNRIEDARNVSLLFSIVTGLGAAKNGIAICADAHDQFVGPLLQGSSSVEKAWSIGGRVIAQEFSVQKDARAKHGFADLEPRYRGNGA